LITELSDVDFIYNKSTGDTHILSPLPSLILKILESEGTASREYLAISASNIIEIDNDSTWRSKIDDALGKLININIIQCN